MSDIDKPNLSKPHGLVRDYVYGKNAAESALVVIARETFVPLYFEKPEVKALLDGFLDEFTRRRKNSQPGSRPVQWDEQWERWAKEVGERIFDFVPKNGPFFPWLPFELAAYVSRQVQMLLGTEISFDYVLKDSPPDIEPFASKPGESLQEKTVRWKKYKQQVDKNLALAHGRTYKRSEAAVQRDVRWYFENKCMGRSVSELTHKLVRKTKDNDKLYSEREKIRDGIQNAEHLLSLAVPEGLEPTEP